jgi:radical SAM superfamily enzyme YgiQ (UPF0313 family)
MKILLFSMPLMDRVFDSLVPISMDAKRTTPPYGIYLLSSVLKEHGHEVTIADLIAEGTNDIKPYLSNLGAYDLVGLGATSFSWPTTRQAIHEIREANEEIPIVVGGIHPSMFDLYVLHSTRASYVIRGEGEIAIVELCEAISGKRKFEEVTSLTYRISDHETKRNEVMRTVDLSRLPIPDYAQLPSDRYAGLSIESSRGCPFDCIFCSTNYRKTYRAMKPAQFVDRIQAIQPFLDGTKQKTVHIIDDEFSLKSGRAHAIVNEIAKRGLSPKLIFDSRARDILNEKFVEAIAPYVGKFLIGAESGYDDGLAKIGKKIKTPVIEKAAGILERNGIAHLSDFSFIIGFPWETYDDVLKTIDFASRLYVKHGVNILLQWYLQIPGSRLWQEQAEAGVLSEALYDDYGLFRNPYLFRTGIRFSLSQFNDITSIVKSIRLVYALSGRSGSNEFEYAHPHPIKTYFPRYSEDNRNKSGLVSLGELSQAVRRLQ